MLFLRNGQIAKAHLFYGGEFVFQDSSIALGTVTATLERLEAAGWMPVKPVLPFAAGEDEGWEDSLQRKQESKDDAMSMVREFLSCSQSQNQKGGSHESN